MSDRPLAVTIVGGLEFLLGVIIFILFILAGAGIGFDTGSAGGLAGGMVAGVIGGVIGGGIPMIIGYGMLKGWKIMWWLGVIFNVISIIGGIITFPVGLVGLVISVIIIYYLFRPGVKSFFGV